MTENISLARSLLPPLFLRELLDIPQSPARSLARTESHCKGKQPRGMDERRELSLCQYVPAQL